MGYLLGIDIGTSGTKTVLFTEKGEVIASHTAFYPLFQPYNGWAEQNPQDWWNAVKEGISAVLSSSAVKGTQITGIGLSGQMHGLVLLDKENLVLRPAILWCDQRTGEECREITCRVGERRLLSITANPALTGFTASKILWVRNHEPEIYEKIRHILLPKDYIRYCLTGEFATEVSDGSGMQLMDIAGRCWSDEVLSLLNIEKSLLPRLYESVEISGRVTEKAASQTGLCAGTPVAGGGGDNAAAAVGCGVVQEGRAFTTIGTSGVVYAHTNTPAIDGEGRVHTFCCAVPGAWHVMGVTQAAGLSLQWFRDQFCKEEMERALHQKIDPYILMDEEAGQIPIGADRLLYLPYLMGERTPHKDPNCRGVFFGLSAMHTRAHLIRAVMEGVAFSMADCMDILREMKIEVTQMMVTGGGAKSLLWRQMLSDLYGCPVTALSSQGPALGAAILAGVGCGIFKCVEDGCSQMVPKAGEPARPAGENTREYQPYLKLYRKLYRDLKQDFVTLTEI
ncbi:MAG: xylulokinase [Clostridia bacterium]|nr:xylulokinase [Clostridia bacterium]